MGLTFPPVFVAIDSTRNEPGTVNEWFLGYKSSSDDRFSLAGIPSSVLNSLFSDTAKERATNTGTGELT